MMQYSFWLTFMWRLYDVAEKHQFRKWRKVEGFQLSLVSITRQRTLRDEVGSCYYLLRWTCVLSRRNELLCAAWSACLRQARPYLPSTTTRFSIKLLSTIKCFFGLLPKYHYYLWLRFLKVKGCYSIIETLFGTISLDWSCSKVWYNLGISISIIEIIHFRKSLFGFLKGSILKSVTKTITSDLWRDQHCLLKSTANAVTAFQAPTAGVWIHFYIPEERTNTFSTCSSGFGDRKGYRYVLLR